MEENAYIGGAIAGLVYLIAGVRLIRLSVGTGEVPERLLGVTFLLWSFSYLFWQLGIALVDESWVTPNLFIGRLLTQAGNVTFLLFLRIVFRSRERWARWLVAAIALGLLVGVAGSVWVGDWESTRPLSNPWYWVEMAGGIALTIWTIAEGFHHYRMARQRLRLGLCHPLVCNRYLLWGLTGVIWLSYEAVVITNDTAFELTGVWPASLDFLLGVFEFSGIALIWFVFFPPRFYQRWFDDSTGTARVGEG